MCTLCKSNFDSDLEEICQTPRDTRNAKYYIPLLDLFGQSQPQHPSEKTVSLEQPNPHLQQHKHIHLPQVIIKGVYLQTSY